MKNIIVSFSLFVAGLGLVLSSPTATALGRNNVSLDFGMGPGGFTLGGEYEHLMKRFYGFGAIGRFFQKDSDKANAPGLFILGANARLHQQLEMFDLSVAPGVALINIDANGDDTTSLGPTFALAVTYQFTDNAAIGLENSRYWVWLDEDFRGLVVDDTSIRLTFNF